MSFSEGFVSNSTKVAGQTTEVVAKSSNRQLQPAPVPDLVEIVRSSGAAAYIGRAVLSLPVRMFDIRDATEDRGQTKLSSGSEETRRQKFSSLEFPNLRKYQIS
jgi:hypothetical protein